MEEKVMEFIKMHGTGNDFIFLLDLDNKYIGQESNLAKKLCHRRFGIGADGIVLVRKSDIADVKMVIVNSDGSGANMCGNAIRCFGKYVFENATLEEIMQVLSRWYDIAVFYKREEVKKLHFTGDLERYKTINDFLEFMEIGGNVRFSIKGKTVLIE